MDVRTNHRDDPQVIDVDEPRPPATELTGTVDTFGEQEAVEEARAARFAAMFAAMQTANTAVIVASSVSLAVGIGIGVAIATIRGR